jgi:hypothetical protein
VPGACLICHFNTFDFMSMAPAICDESPEFRESVGRTDQHLFGPTDQESVGRTDQHLFAPPIRSQWGERVCVRSPH